MADLEESESVLIESPGEPNSIRGVKDLIAAIAGAQASGRRWYRGQADQAWGLQPSIGRNAGHLGSEGTMLKQFMRDAVNRSTYRPANSWEWLALAQHYGIPTRLLDWTEHPLVGLYFACEEPSEGQADGRFFELDPDSLNSGNFPGAPALLVLGHDAQLDTYLPDQPAGPKGAPLAVTSMRYFDRVVAQVGTFTVCQSGENLDGHTSVRSWVVPASSKSTILAELADLNVMASTVYPDLSHLADHIKEMHKR